MKKNEKLAALFAKIDMLNKKVSKIAGIEARFEEYTTEEGVTLNIDGEVDVDKQARVVDPETGEQVAAPDGDYNLNDTNIRIHVTGGVIASMTRFSSSIPIEMDSDDTINDLFNKMFDALYDLSGRVDALVNEVVVMKEVARNEGAVILEMKEQVKKLGKAPSVSTKTKPVAHAPASMENKNLSIADRIRLSHDERQNK